MGLELKRTPTAFSNGIINWLSLGNHPGYIFLKALRLIFVFLSLLNNIVSTFSNRWSKNKNEVVRPQTTALHP